MRPVYGGGPEDVYLVTDADNDLQAGGGYPALFYEGEEPEALQITDLLTMAGAPTAFVVTSDGNDGHAKGQIPRLQAPEEQWEMWCSVNGSPRFLLTGKAGPAIKDLRARIASLAGGIGGGATTLSGNADVDAASVTSAPAGAPLVKRSGGVWAAGTVPTNYLLTGPQVVPVPFGTPPDGELRRWRVLASGPDQVVTFDAAFRTTALVPQRDIAVPDGQMIMVVAEYSTLLTAWVLIEAVSTTGTSTGGGGSGSLSAGPDAALTTAQTFARTATEPAGATITAREWRIVSGPWGEGQVVSSIASVNWKPGVSASGSNDILNPTFKEIALRLAESAWRAGSTNWEAGYADIDADDLDQFGFVGGLLKWSSATGDMLRIVQQHMVENPHLNPFFQYIPGLERCADEGVGTNADTAALQYLGAPFLDVWRNTANNDPVFRKVQRDFVKANYWDDALTQALADGVGPLGLAIYYDLALFYGPGGGSSQFGGILAYVRQRNTRPAAGGDQVNWLNAIVDRRKTLENGIEGNTQVFFHRILINGGTIGGAAQSANLNLVAPIKWSCWGFVHTINARPDPSADSLIGEYVLRYTATGAGTDDVTVTVA